MKNNKKHPLAVFDGKYMYYRKDFVVETIKEIGDATSKDFERQYIQHNITDPSAEGKDVDVRLEKNIAKLNVRNIKLACKYASEYFEHCAKEPKKRDCKKEE